MTDRPETRPEIEPHTWTLPTAQQLTSLSAQQLFWPITSKGKPDLIIFDPPYFDKKAVDYAEKSISDLSKKEYLEFLEAFFALLKRNAKKTTRLAFINADWRDFQNKPAAEESGKGSILIDDYLPDSEKDRPAAYPHHPGPYVRATLQRSGGLCNAKEKDTWSNKQVSDNPAQSKEIRCPLCPERQGQRSFICQGFDLLFGVLL